MADSVFGSLSPSDIATALSNGAQSQWDQAKWIANKLTNGQPYPQPALYAGGPDYPSKDDANAYVRNNWPSDGSGLMSNSYPGTFYTPPGFQVPPGGRGMWLDDMTDWSKLGVSSGAVKQAILNIAKQRTNQ